MNSTIQSPRIVVGVDVSDESNIALREAIRALARIPGGELHVVHAPRMYNAPATVPSTPGQGGSIVTPARHGGPTPPPFVQSYRKLPSQFWERLRTIAQEEQLVPQTEEVDVHIRFERPYKAILDVAEEVGADQVIVGCHGRTGLSRAVLGSVAEQVVRHAKCPVLVARPDGYPRPKHKPEPPREQEVTAEGLPDQAPSQGFSYHTRNRVRWSRDNPDTAGLL